MVCLQHAEPSSRAVGNVAVQYAKNVLGVKRVVGIAGTEKKCEWLRTIGADAAVNYKSPTFSQDLIDATPEGIDKYVRSLSLEFFAINISHLTILHVCRYFDNVGGAILDEVLLSMNDHGIIGACGTISSKFNRIMTRAALTLSCRQRTPAATV